MKDIATRAGKTFIQAFIAAFVLPATVSDANLWRAAVIGAAAAAVSATWNTLSAEIAKRTAL